MIELKLGFEAVLGNGDQHNTARAKARSSPHSINYILNHAHSPLNSAYETRICTPTSGKISSPSSEDFPLILHSDLYTFIRLAQIYFSFTQVLDLVVPILRFVKQRYGYSLSMSIYIYTYGRSGLVGDGTQVHSKAVLKHTWRRTWRR
jgi:hypothetical protein